MLRSQALPYVSFIVDDALNGRSIGTETVRKDSRLVGWQCGFEPLFVAVHSYIPGCRIDECDAADIATDYLQERGWFGADGPTEPDYII